MGRRKYSEWVFGAIKKSGKSAFAAVLILTVLLLFAGPYAEGITVANGREQAASRAFRSLGGS